MSNVSTCSLRLPKSVISAAERIAQEDGISISQFGGLRLPRNFGDEHSGALRRAKKRADRAASKRLLKRKVGSSPRQRRAD